MERLTLLLVLFCGLFSACQTQKQEFIFTVKNPNDADVENKVVVVKRTFIESIIGKMDTTAFLALYKDSSSEYPSQFDDLDDDSNWDELAFSITLKANETKTSTFPDGSKIGAGQRLRILRM